MVGSHSIAFATTDYDELLASEIDGVVLAVPAAYHAALAEKALLAGKHVLIEKPFATSSSDARRLLDLAKSKGLVIVVGHTFLYSPAVRTLKKLIESGAIGQPIYVHSARLNFGLFQPDVNVLWDLAPHDLSILLYLVNRMPSAVATQGSAYYNRAHLEIAHAHLLFDDDLSAHLHVSWLDPNKVRRTTIVGTKQMVIYDDVASGEPLKIYERNLEISGSGSPTEKWRPVYNHGDIYIPRLDQAEPLKEECLDFIESAQRGRTPVSNAELGLRVVQILEHFDISLSNGGGLVSLPAWPEGREVLMPVGSTRDTQHVHHAKDANRNGLEERGDLEHRIR
jgi:predicted dehydrogenase